jgi:ABC-type Mn2+/Zn2+ transport system permease subunit
VPQIWGYLIGDILLLNNFDLMLLAMTAASLLFLTLLFNKEFVYVSVDMEGATAHGLNSRAYHYLMLITSALAIGFATKAVGAILVYAIMIAPAAASNEIIRSVRGVIFAVFGIALISEMLGLAASFAVQASPSAIAGILAALSYVLAIQIRRFRERSTDDIIPEISESDIPLSESVLQESEAEHIHRH